MDAVLLAVAALLGGGVLGGVVAYVVARKSSPRASTDVDELAVEVERIGRSVRRLTMQRVRASAGDAPPDLPPGPETVAPAPTKLSKQQLRALAAEGGLRPRSPIDGRFS